MNSPNTMDLDKMSLQQALRDFETANARVLDLTQRLLRSEQERRALSHELEHLRLRLSQLQEQGLSSRELVMNLAQKVKRRFGVGQ